MHQSPTDQGVILCWYDLIITLIWSYCTNKFFMKFLLFLLSLNRFTTPTGTPRAIRKLQTCKKAIKIFKNSCVLGLPFKQNVKVPGPLVVILFTCFSNTYTESIFSYLPITTTICLQLPVHNTSTSMEIRLMLSRFVMEDIKAPRSWVWPY